MNSPIQIGDCKACGGKVSREAASCPHCGQPSPFQQNISVVLDSQGRPKKIFKPNIPANANTEEIWMPIEGFEGYFSVSSFGNIRSETRTIPHKRHGTSVLKGKIIIPTQTKGGSNTYGVVSFSKDGNQRTFQVHQLVARTFLENPSAFPSVNHIDGNGLNNRLDNLEWINPRDNIIHAYSLGLAQGKRGEKNSSAILTDENVRQIRKYIAEKTFTQRKIAEMFIVVPMVISDIKLGKSWKHVI